MPEPTIPPDPPTVALVVVHFGETAPTRRCLQSLRRLRYPKTITIVIHNGTLPASQALRVEFKDCIHHEILENRGYAAAVNAGARLALTHGTAFVYALNNDTELEPDSLDALVSALTKDATIGIAGGFHYSTDNGALQNAGSYINWRTGTVRTRVPADPGAMAEPDFVCGAGIFFRSSLMSAIGPMDERFFLFSEESDWCLRARAAGYRIVVVPQARLRHTGGASVNKMPSVYNYYATRNKLWLVRRWAEPGDLAAFLVYHLGFAYPKMLLGRFALRDWAGLISTFKGIVAGLGSLPR